jgi:hypothetical protein
LYQVVAGSIPALVAKTNLNNMKVHELNDFNKRKVKVYDIDKKELIAECETMSEASRLTGLKHSIIQDCIKFKHRSYTNRLNKKITFR